MTGRGWVWCACVWSAYGRSTTGPSLWLDVWVVGCGVHVCDQLMVGLLLGPAYDWTWLGVVCMCVISLWSVYYWAQPMTGRGWVWCTCVWSAYGRSTTGRGWVWCACVWSAYGRSTTGPSLWLDVVGCGVHVCDQLMVGLLLGPSYDWTWLGVVCMCVISLW